MKPYLDDPQCCVGGPTCTPLKCSTVPTTAFIAKLPPTKSTINKPTTLTANLRSVASRTYTERAIPRTRHPAPRMERLPTSDPIRIQVSTLAAPRDVHDPKV